MITGLPGSSMRSNTGSAGPSSQDFNSLSLSRNNNGVVAMLRLTTRTSISVSAGARIW